GPLLTYLILSLTSNDLRSVFAWTALPGLLSVLVILLFLRERPQKRGPADQPSKEARETAAPALQNPTAQGAPDIQPSTDGSSKLKTMPLSEAKGQNSKLKIPNLPAPFWMFTA